MWGVNQCELSWKTVRKGIRSASRHPKKPARSLDVGEQLDDKSTKKEVSSVSESEKLGVAVLGRRFAEKIEHVPIKKRRLLLRSPSPPLRSPSPLHEGALSSQHPTPPPQPEVSDQTTVSKCASGPACSSDSVSNREVDAFNSPVVVQFNQANENGFGVRKLYEVNGKLDYTEDFSGIALLAAAACNNNVKQDSYNVKEGPTVDEFLTTEGNDSSVSAPPLASATSSEMGCLILTDSTRQGNKDGSSVQNCLVSVLHNFHNKGDCQAGKTSVPIKDDRLHWDLNTVMEEWELPCDDPNIGSQIKSSEGISDDGMDSEKPVQLEDGVLCKSRTLDTKVSTQVVPKDNSVSLDSSPCPGSDAVSNRLVSDEKINICPMNVMVQKGEDRCGKSVMELGNVASMENVHLGRHAIVPNDLAASEKVVGVIDTIQTELGSLKSSYLHNHIENSPTQLVSTVTCQPSEFEDSVSKSGPFYPSPGHEKSILSTTFGGAAHAAAADVEEKQDKEAPAAEATPIGSSLDFNPNKLVSKSYECSDKIASEDRAADEHGSDVSQGHFHMVVVEKTTKIQAGYESPFEDGELRESLAYSWEENEVEGETECVDYDSDNLDADDFKVGTRCVSEVGSDSNQYVENGTSRDKGVQHGRANFLKESNHSGSIEIFSGQDQLPEGCECSTNRTGETNKVSPGGVGNSDSLDGLDVNGSLAGEVGSRKTKGIFLAQTGGPPCSDALNMKDAVHSERSRSSYDSFFRDGRVLGSEKFSQRDRPARGMQDRSQGDCQWVDSPAGYWNSRNHYPTNYHDQQGTGHPKPRSIGANSAETFDPLNYRDQRRAVNYSSKSVYRPLIRRSSPTNSNDAFTVHKRTEAVRDNSHIRSSRGRRGMYRQGVIRGPREDYHGPMSEDPASSFVRMPHYLARREQSFSPVCRRGTNFSRPYRDSRSRSKSRSRSPFPWRLQGERNTGVRRLNRSPDFRSDARMGRMRMPFGKPSSDDEDAFMSPRRRRFSPPCNSRWIDDRDCVASRFRGRESPGRFVGRSQRFDQAGAPQRIKSDGYDRSMVRPGRFTEMSGGVGRGKKYGNDDSDRSKHGDRCEMFRGRRYESYDNNSFSVRRFRKDVEDSFEAHNTFTEDRCNRGTDRRNEHENARETRGPFRYNNNGTYAAAPKLFEIRGDAEDASPGGA